MKTVGIIGTGTMGCGIAQVAAQIRCDVIFQNRKQASVDRGLARIRKSLERQVAKEKLTESQCQETLERIRGAVPLEELKRCDRVIESAPEDFELKRELLERVKKEQKPFGLIFVDIQGGFTMTGRMIPNSFNVLPIKVYRVYPDGREELVRGVDLIGTPLTAFSNIEMADDRIAVFNGACGAESGRVPVSAVSPGILVSQIEVQKKSKSQERIPILPAPPGPPEQERKD